MLQSIGRVLVQCPAVLRQTRLLHLAGRNLTAQSEKSLDESGDDAHFPVDAEDLEGDTDTRSRYNFDENHIEITGTVRGPPRVYTMPTGRNYAIIKVSTASADRRGMGRFVSFIDIFAPQNSVEYVKQHIREGVQIYVSGQLRSRMRTDEDGKPFQDVRVQASGIFKLVNPKQFVPYSTTTSKTVDSVMQQNTS